MRLCCRIRPLLTARTWGALLVQLFIEVLFTSFIYNIYSYVNTKAKMSFGFSVGDFVAVIDRVNKLRKSFTDAPNQFKDITAE